MKFIYLHRNKLAFQQETNRVVNLWNNLPEDVVCAENLNLFKNKIDNFLKDYIYATNFDLYYKTFTKTTLKR